MQSDQASSGIHSSSQTPVMVKLTADHEYWINEISRMKVKLAISCFKPIVFRASHDDYVSIMEAAINYFR